MKTKKLFASVISLFVFLCFTVFAALSSLHAAAPIPNVTGPISVTGDSYPFNAANHSTIPQDLSKFDYVEEEYFVSGLANIYDFDGDGKITLKAADAPYTTRILVRRPASPHEFSGNIIVELLNPTARYDLDIQWQFSSDYFLAHKDVWVGVTVKPVTVEALKTFDPKRYAPLSMANPLPPDKTCPNPVSLLPDSTPATENGLVWDILSQLGALLKSTSPKNPLHGFDVNPVRNSSGPLNPAVEQRGIISNGVKRVFATGYSQTAGYLVPYINFIRPLPTAALDSGKPVYDGYLIGDGDGLPISINQCSASLKPGDPRFVIQPRPEPVISVGTQTLLVPGVLARRGDSDSPADRYRRYEIPGASHISKRGMVYFPSPADVARAGVPQLPPACTEIDTFGLTDFPLEYFMNGAFANLDAWVRSGTVPPKTPWIKVKNVPGAPVPMAELDQYGNAAGGVPVPYIEVPIATYYARSTSADPRDALFCSLSGYKVPLKKETLAQLYPTHEAYAKKVKESVEAMVKARLITQDDGLKIIKEAEQATVP
jgi:hypothetical protein